MESSDLQHHHRHHQQQMNSGLMRYRSAPSSYFNDMLDREFCQQFFDKPSSPETERIFARFMNSDGGNNNEQLDNSQKLVNSNEVEAEILENQQQQQQPQQQSNANINNYSSSSGFYQSSAKPPLPSQGPSSANNEGSYSLGVNQFPPMRTGGVSNSNLIRHSSSPAGLFANINLDALGFGAMRGMGTFGASNNSTNEEASFSPPSRLNTFSSGPASSPGRMSPITEIDDKSMVVNNQETGVFADGRSNSFVPSFPMNSWDDTPIMPDNITGLKRLREDDVKPYSSETQNVERIGTRPLAHHLSLPKTSSEMAAIDKFLQFQDSVPCKIRAKRGCATHPRSIAERVRRTRISERMRKLQELVPNMEKQTNTADMLDLAVEYIKDLQNQVQTLSDSRAKCTCSNKLKQQQ